jgi:hypothetical protein
MSKKHAQVNFNKFHDELSEFVEVGRHLKPDGENVTG